MTDELNISKSRGERLSDDSEGAGGWSFASDENFGGVLFDSVDRMTRMSKADQALRERLLNSARRRNPLERFTSRISAILGTSNLAASRAIERLSDEDAWKPTSLPGVSRMDVESGPELAACMTAFVRIEPGCGFPVHEHLGDELLFLVQGRCIDTEQSEVLSAGSLHISHAGSSHGSMVSSDESEPLIYLAVVRGGLRIGDTVVEL